MTIGLVLDVLIICMLAATTGYGAVLNRPLGRLRAGQGEFAALIGSFNESARRAEACVHRLRAVGAEGGRAIDDRIEAAQALRDELRYLIERGSRLGESLGAPVAARHSPLKKASLTGFHATAKHIAAKAVSPSSETMRTI